MRATFHVRMLGLRWWCQCTFTLPGLDNNANLLTTTFDPFSLWILDLGLKGWNWISTYNYMYLKMNIIRNPLKKLVGDDALCFDEIVTKTLSRRVQKTNLRYNCSVNNWTKQSNRQIWNDGKMEIGHHWTYHYQLYTPHFLLSLLWPYSKLICSPNHLCLVILLFVSFTILNLFNKILL